MGSSGWNKPVDNQPKPAPKKPSAMRGIAAGLVAVVVVAAGFFFLFSGDSGKVEIKKSEKKPSRIKEVEPAPAPKTLDEIKTTDPEFKKLSREDRIKIRTREIESRSTVRKYNLPTNWQFKGGMQKDAPEIAAMRKKYPPPVIPFDNPAEVTLMGLMEAQDDDVHEERVIDRNFIAQLKESYKKPIEIKETDSAVVKDEKAMMIELKERIKPYLDKGQDDEVIKMLEEEQRGILKRQETRRGMEAYLREAEANGVEGQELVDYHDAVNRLMKEKGMNPIQSIKIERLRRRIQRQAARKKGESE